eukprot:CAMPEP_0170432460 /NCGR_PEP_ID=MMETSP0117_2-20130122/41962_1 /TAXON_ID=400756 /ORGANISM="Durinskia baltica, Strain CSIRO CS-38" /LENGTH=99 /DNA_ID=CAMNT_0010692115 /DNA_START=54 /DNA_END=349 /DNA_ORIENTATION=+
MALPQLALALAAQGEARCSNSDKFGPKDRALTMNLYGAGALVANPAAPAIALAVSAPVTLPISEELIGRTSFEPKAASRPRMSVAAVSQKSSQSAVVQA